MTAQKRKPANPKVALQCAWEWAHLGYGTFGTNLAKGFTDIGFDLWTPAKGDFTKEIPRDYSNVVWASVPSYAHGGWAGQHASLFSMWESTRLPEPMRCRLHNFDTVMVPNDQNAELFGRYHANVVKVPLGYDADVWTYSRRDPPDEQFRILFCGAGAAEQTRKGPDLAIAAFKAAFPKWAEMSPSPRLVIKCLLHPPRAEPFMEIHEGQWPVEQLVDLYRTCHAMLLPSRGEGWGYHPQQAVATGIPAVISEIPGHTEYCWVPGFATSPTKLAKAPAFLHGEAGWWWEAEIDPMVDALRDIYANYDAWAEAAWAGGEIMRNRFTHRHMAEGVVDALGGPAEFGSFAGTEWRKFTERLYPVEVTRRLTKHDCTVGETSYDLHIGARYWLPSHVRQVLFDAGYLANPDEDHPGVAPEEVPAA